jgi:hypothetical protein
MPDQEMFDSSIRSAGDLAGVFELDEITGYFYLYKPDVDDNHKIIASIHIFSGSPDFEESDISIRWNASETVVGLFIRGQLWAAFDASNGSAYGGNYAPRKLASIPAVVHNAFQ